jgi:microcin C transport system substrate-binding protein
MEYPEDRSWVIFNLRKDVKFSDGSRFTADDVLFSYEPSATRACPNSTSWPMQVSSRSEVLDPYRSSSPSRPACRRATCPQQAGGCRSSRKAHYQKNKRDLEKSSLDAVPWLRALCPGQLQAGQQITYKRNPDYWGETCRSTSGRTTSTAPHRIFRRRQRRDRGVQGRRLHVPPEGDGQALGRPVRLSRGDPMGMSSRK